MSALRDVPRLHRTVHRGPWLLPAPKPAPCPEMLKQRFIGVLWGVGVAVVVLLVVGALRLGGAS